MKKVDLITGFLGAGKTTFLKKYVQYLIEQGEKVCILENDLGAVNVDMLLLNELRGDKCELEMVAGGCDADCHRRRFKTKLISMGMNDYTRIIIEPSGIFDVDEFFDSLYDEPLCNWYEIGNVIAIVDAGIEKSLSVNSRYMLASQVADAGMIVLSKTQNCDESVINETKQYVQKTLEEVKCGRNIDKSFFEKSWDKLTYEDFNLLSHCGRVQEDFVKRSFGKEEGFDSVCILEPSLSLEATKGKIDALFKEEQYGNIFRIKGFVLENNEWLEVNATKKEIKVASIPKGQDVIIVIGEKLAEDKIRDLFVD